MTNPTFEVHGVDWGDVPTRHRAHGLKINDPATKDTWRMDDGLFRRECRHWWAKPWSALNRSDRRRLKRRPATLARRQAWDDEADMRWEENFRLIYGYIDTSPRLGMRVTTEDLIPPGIISKSTHTFWTRQPESGIRLSPEALHGALNDLWEKLR